MGFYSRFGYMLFGSFSETVNSYLTDLRSDLKKSSIKISPLEYLSITLLTTFLAFVIAFPLLSFILAYIFEEFLFSFITAFTTSVLLSMGIFTLSINYPKFIMQGKSKEIEDSLPFATLYLSTVAGSKLPLHKTFELFSKFSDYGEITKQIGALVNDIKSFGLDLNTAIERQMERTPSKRLTELLWGILSGIRAGADLNIYLKEKSASFMAEYRRKIYEYSHTLSVYIELYLTSVVLGTIFFTILTAIMAGIGGVQGDIIFLQFILIFMMLPFISVAFIFLIKSSTPGGE
ncbi:MAG: type II secretion system F family protein [Candidatus Aenigmarchaeota archaeon]|nr:type II secretion system F family protein [Candidatus Aenigmarchaeota archaeon]